MRRLFAAFVLIPLAFCAAAQARVTYIRPVVKDVPLAGIENVVVQNLVGPITIRTVSSSAAPTAHLELLVHSGALDRGFARTLAQQLTFSVQPEGNQLRITANYPVSHFTDYAYPKVKDFLHFFHGTEKNDYQGHHVYVHSLRDKHAVELWAEIRLSLPSGYNVYLQNNYGDVTIDSSGAAPGGANSGLVHAFTDYGDFHVIAPAWTNMTLITNWGSIRFPDGLGNLKDVSLTTSYGSCWLYLLPGTAAKIYAHRDLGFLKNKFNDAKFSKEKDEHVMTLGDGNGPVIHINMDLGNLHLQKAA